MKILQFKIGGEYEYHVTFETIAEKRKIQTNEEPKGDLLSVISKVVVAAVNFFRLNDITASFRQITFSYPEKAPDGFVIELNIKARENVYVTHTLKSERLLLSTNDTESSDEGFQERINQNNTLVEKIVALRDEIEAYALGARMQQDLPFEGDDEDKEDSLFGEDE